MNEHAKVRINMSTGEIEIVGSEDFIQKNVELVERVINRATTTVIEEDLNQASETQVEEKPAAVTVEKPEAEEVEAPGIAEEAAEEKSEKSDRISLRGGFAKYMEQFTKKVRKGDLILAAGYYFQKKDESNQFSTFNTSKLLKEIGAKMANPSQYVKNNMKANRIEMLGKRSYRITKEGEARLKSLR